MCLILFLNFSDNHIIELCVKQWNCDRITAHKKDRMYKEAKEVAAVVCGYMLELDKLHGLRSDPNKK